MTNMIHNNTNMSQQKIYSYFDRDPELRVLFIFNDEFLKDELSEATWKDGYRYVVFQGDWFTCKYLLDTDWAEEKVILYFDMASPLQDKAVQERFPLLDVLCANAVYHHEDYIAFMQQYNLPPSMAAFVEKNIFLLQSGNMRTMLEPYYRDGSINTDVATRGVLSLYLLKQHILTWDEILIHTLLLGRSSERKKEETFYKKLQGAKMVVDVLQKRFTDLFGVPLDMNSAVKVGKIVQVFKYNAIVQNLALAEADNYKAMKIDSAAKLQQINRMLELILNQPKSAVAFEELLKEYGATIRCEEILHWYGAGANYYYIPEDMYILILRNILEDDISTNYKKVLERLEYIMTSHNDRASYGDTLEFIVDVAQYYEKTNALSSFSLNSPNEYVDFYEKVFYEIDLLYRSIMEIFYKLSPDEVLFDSVQSVKVSIDLHYAKIANRLNLVWSDCLKTAGGLSSLPQLRQWNFYDSVIKPIQKKVAVIVCDALRYEMAKSLLEKLAKSKHTATISAAIATLPTETKFCKPSLLPYTELKLYGVSGEENMSVDDKILDDTDKRSLHLQSYRDDAICIPFSDIVEYNKDKNREIFKHSLVYIFHNDIDKKGHSDSAKDIVAGCAQAIEDIAVMIPKILASYNVTEVYVTSDHGFLFNEIQFEEKDKFKVTEESLEQKVRYYLTSSTSNVNGVIKFPLREVSGMINADEIMVAVPYGTNRFAAPSGGYMFAHGGASLQELIIPIIVCQQERTDTKEPVGVMVLDRRLSIQASRLRFKLLQTEAVDMDTKERIVSVALYLNNEAVTPINKILLDKTDPSLDNRKITVDLTLNQNVDAKILQLKVYDIDDENNPLIVENVTNNTLIENDFDY